MRGQGPIIKFTDEKRKELEANAFARLVRSFKDAGGKEVPPKWTVTARQRETGVSKGDIDYQYHGPSGKRYRSQREAVNQMLHEARQIEAKASGGEVPLPPAPPTYGRTRDSEAKLHPEGFQPLGKRIIERPDYSLVKRRKRGGDGTPGPEGEREPPRRERQRQGSPTPAGDVPSGCSYSLGSRASQLFRELDLDADNEVSDYGSCLLAWRLSRAARQHQEAVGLRQRLKADEGAAVAAAAALDALAGAASMEVEGDSGPEVVRVGLVTGEQAVQVVVKQEGEVAQPVTTGGLQPGEQACAPEHPQPAQHTIVAAGLGHQPAGVDEVLQQQGGGEAGGGDAVMQPVTEDEPVASAVAAYVDMSEQAAAHGTSGDGEGEGEGEHVAGQPLITANNPTTATDYTSNGKQGVDADDDAQHVAEVSAAAGPGGVQAGDADPGVSDVPEGQGRQGRNGSTPGAKSNAATPSLRRRSPRVAVVGGEESGQAARKRVTRASATATDPQPAQDKPMTAPAPATTATATAATAPPTTGTGTGIAATAPPTTATVTTGSAPEVSAAGKAGQQEQQVGDEVAAAQQQQQPLEAQQPQEEEQDGGGGGGRKAGRKRSRELKSLMQDTARLQEREAEQESERVAAGAQEVEQQGAKAQHAQQVQSTREIQPQSGGPAARVKIMDDSDGEVLGDEDAAAVLAEGLAVAYRRRKLRTQEVTQRHAAHLLRSIAPSMQRMMRVVQGLQAAGVSGEVFQEFGKAVRRMRGAVRLLSGVPHVVELSQAAGQQGPGSAAAGVVVAVGSGGSDGAPVGGDGGVELSPSQQQPHNQEQTQQEEEQKEGEEQHEGSNDAQQVQQEDDQQQQQEAQQKEEVEEAVCTAALPVAAAATPMACD